MNLAPDQQKWCEWIRNGKIDSVLSFLENEKILEKTESDDLDNIFFNSNYSGNKRKVNVTLPFANKMKEFVSLWHTLKNEGLIFTYKYDELYWFDLEYKSDLSGNHGCFINRVTSRKINATEDQIKIRNLTAEFVTLFSKLFTKTEYVCLSIIPHSSLNAFIENKFKTDKEVESDRNNRNTKWAIGISGLLAFASLVVSLFAVFKEPSRQPVEIINLDSAMEKYSRAAVVRASYEDSLSKAHRSPHDTSFARAGKKTSK